MWLVRPSSDGDARLRATVFIITISDARGPDSQALLSFRRCRREEKALTVSGRLSASGGSRTKATRIPQGKTGGKWVPWTHLWRCRPDSSVCGEKGAGAPAGAFSSGQRSSSGNASLPAREKVTSPRVECDTRRSLDEGLEDGGRGG